MGNEINNEVTPSPVGKFNEAITEVAKQCHEVNRDYCKSIGDDSQPAWADAPDWQRESAVNGVLFHLNNPDAGPSASHDSWLAEKAAAGWKYGEVKNPEAKEHPCFVPYDDLSDEQKEKDSLFIETVDASREQLLELNDVGSAAKVAPSRQSQERQVKIVKPGANVVEVSRKGTKVMRCVKEGGVMIVPVEMDMATAKRRFGQYPTQWRYAKD
jgi:hypothetical protein